MSKIKTKKIIYIYIYSLGITINNQKKNLICKAPHQSPIYLACIGLTYYFGIMKKFILIYEKSKETEDYLKTGVELKLFKICLKIGVSKII